MQPLRHFWSATDLTPEDRFLRDYITDHRWREPEAIIPTYDEVRQTVLSLME